MRTGVAVAWLLVAVASGQPTELEVHAPARGQRLAGQAQVVLTAGADVDPASVTLLIDGEPAVRPLLRQPDSRWTTWWDTWEVFDGRHYLQASGTTFAGEPLTHTTFVAVANGRDPRAPVSEEWLDARPTADGGARLRPQLRRGPWPSRVEYHVGQRSTVSVTRWPFELELAPSALLPGERRATVAVVAVVEDAAGHSRQLPPWCPEPLSLYGWRPLCPLGSRVPGDESASPEIAIVAPDAERPVPAESVVDLAFRPGRDGVELARVDLRLDGVSVVALNADYGMRILRWPWHAGQARGGSHQLEALVTDVRGRLRRAQTRVWVTHAPPVAPPRQQCSLEVRDADGSSDGVILRHALARVQLAEGLAAQRVALYVNSQLSSVMNYPPYETTVRPWWPSGERRLADGPLVIEARVRLADGTEVSLPEWRGELDATTHCNLRRVTPLGRLDCPTIP